ncbi:MAG TPA: ABC transporter ATP-binding protein [Bacillota bacterium]|jgi:ATP-binding cassette subfamily B multidrug efflux pump|nr:ABC transporter ATP-binding protein [Bacillota bacterium]HPZ21742.1 ABC transporter ATP-binding protein [Bacillota bacterium]HQD19212.1 ABC transporter ATP-binding protein [Bacillota bacterium]
MFNLLKYLKPYWRHVILVLILVLLQSLSQLFLPTLMADIVDKGIAQGDNAAIFRLGGIMLAVALGNVACAIGASFFSARLSMGYGRVLRNEVFSHVQRFSLREYNKFGAASLITRITNDVTQMQMVVFMSLRMLVTAPLMMIGGIVLAVSRDPNLSRLLLILMPVITAGVIGVAYLVMPLFRAIQAKLDKLNLVLRENLTGIRVIRAFNREKYEQQRFDIANLDLTMAATFVNRLMGGAMPAMFLLMNLASLAILWFGGQRVAGGALQVGDLMAFLQYMMQIMFSLMMVSMMFVMLPRALASVKRINEVLQTRPEIVDPERAVASDGPRGYIEFRDVTFSYPGAEVPVLQNISFRAGPGEVTAIIGGTGSGKSTLASLIPRFYDVDSGSILVDGVDIRDMSQETLRDKIGFVPQQALLFTGTIASNIRMGKEEATLDEVRKAAETAQALEFITAMPDGFDSEVAQGGVNFSGGQKQRLAIARALVRRPEIYIFDDSFSALDFRTESRLRRALKDETAGATVIIVAQRVATVMDADRIIVLEKGTVAGIGTHEELMKDCNVYREIVLSQVSEEELA